MQFVSRAARSVSYALAYYVKDRPFALRCRRLLLLMCCHSPAGWAGPDRPRWRSLSFPQLSRLAFAWLMNCDGTQLQGCLCFVFFILPEGRPVKAGVWNIVKLCWWLSTFVSAGSADTLRWTPERSTLSGCKSRRLYSQLLVIQEEERKQRHKPAPTCITLHNSEWVSPVIAGNGLLELPGNLRHESNLTKVVSEEIGILFKPFPSLISQFTLTFKPKLALNCFCLCGYSLYTTEKVFLCAREVLILCRFFSSQQVRNKSLYFQDLLNFCWKGIQHCKCSTCQRSWSGCYNSNQWGRCTF